MLDEKINTCFGCLIGLVNAMENIEDYPFANVHIQSCLVDLKENRNINQWIEILREDKKKIVPDCFVCMNPCGRTDEIYLNALGEKYVNKALSLLENVDNMTLKDIFYALGSLPYDFD